MIVAFDSARECWRVDDQHRDFHYLITRQVADIAYRDYVRRWRQRFFLAMVSYPMPFPPPHLPSVPLSFREFLIELAEYEWADLQSSKEPRHG